MEMIAPLAKVLAEANGIDWHDIRGSGSGGQVVEQDILNYLTRIMSGDEEPPATPVDAPPPDWDGQAPSPELLAAAGFEGEMADFMSAARQGAPDLASDSLDFELELDDEETAPAESQPADASFDFAPQRPDAAPTASFFAAPQTSHPAQPGMSLGGGLLSSMYGGAPAQAPEAAPAPPMIEPEPVQPAPVPVSEPVAPAFVMPEPAAPVAAFISPEPAVAAPIAPEPIAPTFAAMPEPVAAEPVAQPAPAPAVPVMPEPVSAPAPVVAAEVTPAPRTFERPALVPISGATLRLSFDATALSAASAQLAEHFGGQPAPLAAFVARAAVRAVAHLGLSSVGVLGAAQDFAPLATPNLGEGFRAAADDIPAATPGEPSELMVADAGEIGLDELHLPSEGPVLTLGRIRGAEAILTLSNTSSVREGAAFLKEVAALLEAPIRLMM